MDNDPAADTLEMYRDFLYLAPVGLMRFRLNGSVDMVTPMVPRILMPLLPDLDLSDAYRALASIEPDLLRRLRDFPDTVGLVIDHELCTVVSGGNRVVLALTVQRLDGDSQVAMIEDVTKTAERERLLLQVKADLERRTHYDAQTGLPNRTLLELRLTEAEADADATPLLLFLDLDGAKTIRDTMGYAAGDAAMIEVAQRLVAVAEPDGFAARLGGNQFVVLCRRLDLNAATALAQRAEQAIAAPMEIAGLACSVSVTTVIAGGGAAGRLDLTQAADRAMQQARSAADARQNAEAQRQKMEALGRMMGGVAHEINNMLQPVVLLVQDVLDNGLGAEDARPHLDVVVDCTKKARQIIGDLLAFSRPTARTTEVLDPDGLLEDSLRLVRQALPGGVAVSMRREARLPRVAINRTTFVQILLNLATNAAAAMDGQGTLAIMLDAAPQTLVDRTLADFVRLTVTDSGCGMSKATLDRAFEPFFTTKPVGQGTGLGLPVVYGLMQEIGGRITLASEPGCGTTVTVLIPVVTDRPDQVKVLPR